MSLAPACSLCDGRGSRVVAAIFDPHYGPTGSGPLLYTEAIPIIAPCVCAAERAARTRPRLPA